MITAPVLVFAVIGALGVGSQWLAWRLRLPAIVLMLAAGLVAGPATGLIDPEAQLGDLFRPIIAIAVAVILFEGGLTLNFNELGSARPALRRLVWVGAPLGWLTATLACFYVAGLHLATSAVFGGILVVTGPTVTIPLLRQAKLAPRPASLLKWEAIVNDPIGALFAVFAFEIALVMAGSAGPVEAALHLIPGVVIALVVGGAAGWVLVRAFVNGWAPEYMKAPILLAAVLIVYAATDLALHESGLLAVTVMGAVMGNARLPSLVELTRFKEHMTVLLVSGVFILLAASLDFDMVLALDWRAVAFVIVIIVVARPVAVLVSLIGAELTTREKLITAWVAPRGVVAVAVAGFFGARLQDIGHADGALLPPLAFVLVAATVLLHGFTVKPVARALKLTSTEPPGVVIVGASPFALTLAEGLAKIDAPVLIADDNWFALRPAKREGRETWRGEVLSEAFEHDVDLNRYGHLIAATPNDAYNALVCTNYAPEFGRNAVRQIARHDREEADHLPISIGGRGIAGAETYEALNEKARGGWRVSATKLTGEYGLDAYLAEREDVVLLGVARKGTEIAFFGSEAKPEAKPGDVMLALTPPERETV